MKREEKKGSKATSIINTTSPGRFLKRLHQRATARSSRSFASLLFSNFIIPKNLKFSAYKFDFIESEEDLLLSGIATQNSVCTTLRLMPEFVLAIDLENGVKAQFRYIPTPKKLISAVPWAWTHELYWATLVMAIAAATLGFMTFFK